MGNSYGFVVLKELKRATQDLWYLSCVSQAHAVHEWQEYEESSRIRGSLEVLCVW